MRRLALLLFGGGALWLLLAAAPAFADNGPHIRKGSGLTADSCAGCHRAHSAQNPLLTLSAQPALCFACHGSDGAGSQLNVVGGRKYGPDPVTGLSSFLGALRGGGFEYALLGSSTPTRVGFGPGNGTIPALALADAEPVTSHHTNDFSDAEIWGNGPISSPTVSLGTATELRCGSCHNPHGEYSYRVLRENPVDSGATTGATGTRVLIPDVAQWTQSGSNPPVGTVPSGAKYEYTTTNYWIPWDTNWYGANYVLDGDPDGVGPLGNQEQLEWTALTTKWCTTCHTRYLAPSGSFETDSGDAVFKYRHPTYGADVTLTKTNSGTPPTWTYNAATFTASSIPACLQCHVSHGTNSTMGTYSGAIPLPGGAANTTGETSRLLRVDNRGVCQMCHFK